MVKLQAEATGMEQGHLTARLAAALALEGGSRAGQVDRLILQEGLLGRAPLNLQMDLGQWLGCAALHPAVLV